MYGIWVMLVLCMVVYFLDGCAGRETSAGVRFLDASFSIIPHLSYETVPGRRSTNTERGN